MPSELKHGVRKDWPGATLSLATQPGVVTPGPCDLAEVRPSGRPNVVVLVMVTGLAVVVTAEALVWGGARAGALAGLGFGLGALLYRLNLCFSSAWRNLVSVGNGAQLRAQTIVIGVAATIVMVSQALGVSFSGAAPVPPSSTLGFGLVLGSFLFGIGMQLGGSCASGTLFAAGAGQMSILFTLGGFIVGAVFYTWAFPLMGMLPRIPDIRFVDYVGWWGSWGITALLLAIVATSTIWYERKRRRAGRHRRITMGPVRAAAAIGLLAGFVFLVAGKVWSVADAYGLWGAKLLQLVGLSPVDWPYWQQDTQAHQLAAPLWNSVSTMTNVGIMLGAAVVAAAVGAWKLRTSLPIRVLAAAFLGGILMGFGARMSGGCNIGAFVGGLSLGDVSGWVWGGCAIGGSWVGLHLRNSLSLDKRNCLGGSY